MIVEKILNLLNYKFERINYVLYKLYIKSVNIKNICVNILFRYIGLVVFMQIDQDGEMELVLIDKIR